MVSSYAAPDTEQLIRDGVHPNLADAIGGKQVVEVDVENSFIVVSDAPAPAQLKETPTSADFRELGSTGSTSYYNLGRSDYNPTWMGKTGMLEADQMRRSDGQVAAVLRLVKTPILSGDWYVDPPTMEDRDVRIANHVQMSLARWMSTSWYQTLYEITSMLDFGFYCFEKVFTLRKNKVIWKKLAPRHPLDLEEWKFDRNGGPTGAWFWSSASEDGRVFIPIEKLLIFSFQKESGNLDGVSVLRPLYKHWYYKDNLYKIDAIQKERHGIGVPIILLPSNFDDDDLRRANEIGRNLRTNERAHVVLPPNWEITFAKIEGQPVSGLDSAEHHDLSIARGVLGQFINKETASDQEKQQELFLKSTRSIADTIRDVFNHYAIPQLVDYNWSNVEEYPELKVRAIGDTLDLRTMSFALRNLVGAKLVEPDGPTEDWLRYSIGMPRKDPSTVRKSETPQAPGGGGEAGPPRQSQAGNQRQAKTPGGANVGRDGSGTN